jgi:hypothetical protein
VPALGLERSEHGMAVLVDSDEGTRGYDQEVSLGVGFEQMKIMNR